MQAGVVAHVSLQIEFVSHWKVQPPPSHESVHVAPAAHLKTQLPPVHEAWQVAPAGQSISQPPAGHVVTQGGTHEQPASGSTCAASHAKRAGASAEVSGDASPPPSGTTQLAMTAESSSATVHCTSSLIAIAFSQVSFGPGRVQ
jgi:hypothetical protein